MFFLIVYGLFLLSNLLLYWKLRRSLWVWFPAAPRRRIGALLALFFAAVNSPLLLTVMFGLEGIPDRLLRWYYYPGFVWFAMLIGYFLVTAPKDLIVGIARSLAWVWRRATQPAGSAAFSPSRRGFLAGLAPALPSALLGTAAYGVYGTAGELEVSPEIPVPVPNLPRQLDGLRLTQLSDIHFGPYMRSRDMTPVVEAANALGSELIVITGDILDRSLAVLPDAVESLSRLRAPHGVYGILGNHDYYADQRRPGYSGCNRLVEGLESAGVRFLRNSVASVRLEGGAELLVAGLDWLGATRGDPNIYQQQRTEQALGRMLAGANPEAPRVLLTHHPYSFLEAQKFDFPLTLAGHTHGGGQVVFGQIRGVPLGLASLRFRYVRGLYQEEGRYLYVNRGIGYFGIPIRINCLPEISRFRLVRA